jgi:Na+-translocating ferredoxin:NAD+ oxidoreductase RNF subunit RnfB
MEAFGPRSLAMTDGIAALVAPDTCGSDERCIAACKDDAIQMKWVAFVGDRTVRRWRVEECGKTSSAASLVRENIHGCPRILRS